MYLSIKSIPEGVSHYHSGGKRGHWAELTELAESLEREGFEIRDEFSTRFSITRQGGQFYLQGDLLVGLGLVCARCMESFSYSCSQSFEGLFVSTALGLRNSGSKASELDINYFRGQVLDLSLFLREYFILAIPFQPLCSPQCRGLCHLCGTNLNKKSCGCESGQSRKGESGLVDLLEHFKQK